MFSLLMLFLFFDFLQDFFLTVQGLPDHVLYGSHVVESSLFRFET